MVDWLGEILDGYKGGKISIATIGSHSALNIFKGAREEDLRTVCISIKGREKIYDHYNLVDKYIWVENFHDILKEPVQEQLRQLNSIIIPHGSFNAYVNQEEMEKKFEVEDLRFFLQKYLPEGKEVIVGAKAEKGLGHLVMFGIGGIYVEILKDVVFKIAPVTTVEAREMLSSLKMTPLLRGVRGERGVDEEGIIEIIQRLSQLVTELPMIQEMDLNPVIAYEDRAFVVDARVSVARC